MHTKISLSVRRRLTSPASGAEASQMEEHLGTLEVGKIADLLVVNEDPLEDISNMRKIDQVIKEGKFIDRDKLPETSIMQFEVAVSAHGVVGQPLMFTPEVLKVIAEEVHAAGKIYETHTVTPESLRLAIESGADLLQHPEVLDHQEIPNDLVALIKEKNIFCGILTRFSNPKRIVEERSKYPYWYRGMDPSSYEQWHKNVYKLIAAGVRVAMATDMGPQAWELAYRGTSPILGRMHFETMEDYQTAGMSPMQVLVASTKTGAEASQMEEDLGILEVGKIADLLVVNEDPLEDISNMRKIDQVMKEGKLIDRDKLPETSIMQFDPEGEFGDYMKKRSTSNKTSRR